MKRLISLCVINLLLLGPKDSVFSLSSNSPLSSNSSLSPRCSSLLSISSMSPPSLPPAALEYIPYISMQDYVPSSVYCYLPAIQTSLPTNAMQTSRSQDLPANAIQTSFPANAMQTSRSQDCAVSPRFTRFASVPWEQYQTFSFRKTIISDFNRTVQDWFTDLVRSQSASPCTGGLNQVAAIATTIIASLGPQGWHKHFTDFITSRSLYAVILNDESNFMFKDLIGGKFKNEINYDFHTNSKEGIYVDKSPGYGEPIGDSGYGGSYDDSGYGYKPWRPNNKTGYEPPLQDPRNTTMNGVPKNESVPCGTDCIDDPLVIDTTLETPSDDVPEPNFGAPKPSYAAGSPTTINRKYHEAYEAYEASYGIPGLSNEAPLTSYAAPSEPYGAPSGSYAAPSEPYGGYGYVDEYENNTNILDYMAENIASGLAFYLKNKTNWSLASEAVGCLIDYLGESENTMMEILVTNITKEEVVDTVKRLTESMELLVEHENLEEGLKSIFTAVADAVRAIDFDKITLHIHQMILRARTGAFGVDIAELLKTILDMIETLTSAAEAFKSGDWPEVKVFTDKIVSVIESDEFWIGLDNAYIESVSNAKMLYYSRILSYRDAFLTTLRHVTTRLELFVNDFEQNFDDLVERVNEMKLDNCLVWLIDRPYAWLGPVATSHGQLACWLTDFLRRVKKMDCLKMDWVDDYVDRQVWPKFPERLLNLWEKLGSGVKGIAQGVVGTCPRDGWFLWLK